MKKVGFLFLLMTGIILLQGFINSSTGQTFNPIADAYVRGGSYGTMNYGTAKILAVKKGTEANYFRKSYVKFDLVASGLTSISSAKVRLYASSVSTFSVTAFQGTDNWTETGITWNNAPVEGKALSAVNVRAAGTYYEWDVSAFVQSQLSGDKIITFVFYDAAANNKEIDFNSREASSNKPQLVIVPLQAVPAAPANVTAVAVSSAQINLTWTDNSSNEDGFKIERKTGTGSWSQIASVGANATIYNNTGLAAGTTYTYRVYSWNTAGNSAYSNEAGATTSSVITTDYYVDNSAGKDVNDGRTAATAWKTLSKVNGTSFTPGSRILFKAGGVWIGQLYPKGSGISGNPIIIDMYGTGNKPLIDGNGMTGTGVVYLLNQQYWEINNLEITNNAATAGDRRGVRIEVDKTFGTANHIYLKNLNVHNIKGTTGQTREDKRTGGIGFGIINLGHFNDILIEGCQITSCDNQGIITECVAGDGYDPFSASWNAIKITNAAIRNNTISDISKNAMIIRLFENGVIENNICYNTAKGISGNTIFSAACSGTVFQYNEGYGNNSPDADGSMYDADLRSPNTFWQYSYSHDNAHGLFWTCTVQADVNVTCRYNISQNDKGIIFCINYPATSVYVYNNTVYCGANTSPVIISERNVQNGTRTYYFHNNIIYNMSTSATYDFRTSGYTRTIDYNCFFGNHPLKEPADAHKITADPKLVNPGSGGFGINSVNGYQLQSASPCINTGKSITNNGGKDYWGNALYNGNPDIGANEYYPAIKDATIQDSKDPSIYNPSIKIYPNPAGNSLFEVNLTGFNKRMNTNFIISNSIGQVIYNKKLNNETNLKFEKSSFLRRGIYFITVKAEETVVSEKLIIQ